MQEIGGTLFIPGKTVGYLRFLTRKQGTTPRTAMDLLKQHVSDRYKNRLDWAKIAASVAEGWEAHETFVENERKR